MTSFESVIDVVGDVGACFEVPQQRDKTTTCPELSRVTSLRSSKTHMHMIHFHLPSSEVRMKSTLN